MKDQAMRALKYAVAMLEKEWEKSGQTKKVLEASTSELYSLIAKISREAKESNKVMEDVSGVSFKESLLFSKRNYILLRLGQKMAKAIEKAEKKGTVFAKLELDKEEALIYEKFAEEQE